MASVAAGFLILLLVYTTNAACTWPSNLAGSTWRDGEKGDVTFLETTATGLAFTVQVQLEATPVVISEWECVEYDPAGPYLVMRTTTSFIQFVVRAFVAFRCLKLTQITEASYRYYQIDPIQPNFNNERLNILDNATQLSSAAELCNETLGASGSEYRVLVKKGSENSSQITCPYVILADYSYTYTASDETASCNVTSDIGSVDMCSTKSQLTLQYPPCTSLTVYSTTDTVWCIDVVTVGEDIFVTLFNGHQDIATIDKNSTHLFSCIGIASAGHKASVTPQYCKQNQTSEQLPTDNSGSSIGAALALTRTGDYCPPCPVLAAPGLGSVSVSTDGAVTMATYTCDAGYTIAGDVTRTCQANGTWSGDYPTCTCALPTAPINGSVTSSVDGLTLTYSCDAGTVLNGATTRACQTETNTWTGSAPTCDTCDSLAQPENGSYAITSTGLTSVVVYSCDAGTSLNGDVSRTCQLDSTWDGSTPTCMVCPSLDDPASGTVTIATDGTMSIATFACVAGYTIVGESISACIAGAWNSSSPTCVCEVPASPENGSVQVSSDGYAVTYTCDVGFTLSGQSGLMCLEDASGWDFTFPVCVSCGDLTPPTNGSLTLSTNGKITIVTYACNVGFSMNGDVTAECSAAGSWSSVSPTCSECAVLATPVSANISYTSDGATTSALYTCDAGTSLSGDVTVTCDSSGAWPGTAANVACIACASLTSSVEGTFDVTSNGTTSSVTFSCQPGYTLSGAAEATCQTDGTLSSEQPSCVPNSTNDDTDGDQTLLPVVIALAILTAVLLAALGAALIYIYLLKRKKTTAKQSAYDKISDPAADPKYILGKMLNDAARSSAAPVGHQHHVLHNGSDATNAGSSSLSRAPSSHMSNGSFWRDCSTPGSVTPSSVLSGPMSMPGSATPRSVKSAASISKLRLGLVQEATSGSLNLDTDVPAPWTLHNNTRRQSPRRREPSSPRGQTSPQRKQDKESKSSVLKKGVAEELMLDLSSVIDTPRDNTNIKPKHKSPRKERAKVLVSGNNHSMLESKQPAGDRATTPVRHVLTVKDVETPRTPRSNQITTIQ